GTAGGGESAIPSAGPEEHGARPATSRAVPALAGAVAARRLRRRLHVQQEASAGADRRALLGNGAIAEPGVGLGPGAGDPGRHHLGGAAVLDARQYADRGVVPWSGDTQLLAGAVAATLVERATWLAANT